MSTRMRSVLGLSALCIGLAVTPANAGSARSANISFACDGTNKHIDLNLGGFPASSTQFILGGEIIIFENHGGLQYIILRGEANSNKHVLGIGTGGADTRIAMPTFYQVTATAAGNVLVGIDGACNPGFGQIQALVSIYFN